MATFDDGNIRGLPSGNSEVKKLKTRLYFVQDGAYKQRFTCQEHSVVSTVMSTRGMSLYGASVRYHIQRLGWGNRDKKTARSPSTSWKM